MKKVSVVNRRSDINVVVIVYILITIGPSNTFGTLLEIQNEDENLKGNLKHFKIKAR